MSIRLVKTKWTLLIPILLVAAILAYKFVDGRELTGYVRDAETNQPLVGAAIEADGHVAATDDEGKYSLALGRGKFSVTVQADGYAATQADVDASELMQREVVNDFALTANRIAGLVRDAETNQPLPDLVVFAVGKTLRTDAHGIFELRAIKLGTPVLIRAPGYQPASVVFSNQPAFNLALLPNVVNFAVTDQYSNKPVSQAQIQSGDQKVTTDTDGHAILRRVRTGTTVRATAPGYEDATASFSGNDLNSTFNLQFALRPNTLDGVITDASTNQPIANATLVVGTAMTTTNALGAYHLENVPPNLSLAVLVPGYLKAQVEVKNTLRRDVKLQPFAAKGIHVPYSVTPENWNDLVTLVGKTELNAIVLDVKSERGTVAWNSQVPLAKQIGAVRTGAMDLSDIVKTCRAKRIYCIARLPVFQDTLLAEARPDYAIKYTNGVVYNENGVAWTNAFNQDVWAYNIALAKEVAAIGFDEIQFDYVRFPGRVGAIYLGGDNTEESRVNAIKGFLQRAQRELHPSGVFVSADIFGLTAATDDEQNIGQRMRDLGPYIDYISPMVYPDTWGTSYDLLRSLGISKCEDGNRCPYDVILNSYKRSVEKTSTKVRLWLQGYSGTGNFGLAEYKTQRKAVQDAGGASWLFWNPQGNYSAQIFGPPE